MSNLTNFMVLYKAELDALTFQELLFEYERKLIAYHCAGEQSTLRQEKQATACATELYKRLEKMGFLPK